MYLWVAGEDLRAVYDHVLVAEYACHYNLRTGTVTDLRLGQWYPSPFAARQAQGTLVERTPQDSVVVAPSQSCGVRACAETSRTAGALYRVPERLNSLRAASLPSAAIRRYWQRQTEERGHYGGRPHQGRPPVLASQLNDALVERRSWRGLYWVVFQKWR